jgi:hypothetical protein
MIEDKIYNEIPAGWSVIHGAMTAPVGHIWISNNKSYFGGERRSALLAKGNE